MSTGSTTADIYVLLITFVVGFALGCVVEYLREQVVDGCLNEWSAWVIALSPAIAAVVVLLIERYA